MPDPTREAMLAERRGARPDATAREAIDELVEAYALMTNPLTIGGLAIARVRVLAAIAVLRAMEAGR